MGIRATLTVISSSEYRRLVKEARQVGDYCLYPSARYRGIDIDKGWMYLEDAFSDFGEPLASAFKGDCRLRDNGGDGWRSLASPALVERTAAELVKLPSRDVVARCLTKEARYTSDPQRLASLQQYVEFHYGQVQRAYAVAAKRGGAIYIEAS